MRRVHEPTNRGVSFVGTIIVMMALLFVVIAGLSFYNVLNDRSIKVENRITAVGLVVSQIEDLLERVYSSDAALNAGGPYSQTSAIEDVPVGFGISYTVSETNGPSDTYVASPYKIITVRCTYPGSGGNEVSITAYKVEE